MPLKVAFGNPGNNGARNTSGQSTAKIHNGSL